MLKLVKVDFEKRQNGHPHFDPQNKAQSSFRFDPKIEFLNAIFYKIKVLCFA
jgi:hypothetical protein